MTSVDHVGGAVAVYVNQVFSYIYVVVDMSNAAMALTAIVRSYIT